MHYCLLPGLHGDGTLFADFVAQAPEGSSFTSINYPTEGPFDYNSLLNWVIKSLPTMKTYTIVGESFGGPLAILIASTYPNQIEKVILVGSFARSPAPWLPDWLPHNLLKLLPQRNRIPRILLAGFSRSKHVDKLLKVSLASLTKQAFLGRTKAIRTVDVRSDVSALVIPILYLQASQDYLVPASRGMEIIDNARVGTLVCIKGPHMLLGTHPKECWTAILNSNVYA